MKKFAQEFSSSSKFKRVKVYLSESNKGLAQSVIYGVSEIIRQYGKVIVLEDDLIVTRDFLTFMNGALEFYENKNNIWSISGCTINLPSLKRYNKDVYVQYRASSWGWATWANRWDSVDWNLKNFNPYKLDFKLDRNLKRGGNDLKSMLRAQYLGKINSWAIRWVYQQCKESKLCIYPSKSKVINRGLDGSGTHSTLSDKKRYNFELENVETGTIHFEDVSPDKKLIKEFQKKYKLSFYIRIRDKVREINKFYFIGEKHDSDIDINTNI